VAGAKTKPGETISVRIESIDPAKGDARFRML
jgi:hypothetical protein